MRSKFKILRTCAASCWRSGTDLRPLLMLAVCLFARNLRADTFKDDLAHAKTLYFKGVEDDSAALKQATDIFTSLAQHDSTNATILAYLGSIRLLEAAHTWALLSKSDLAHEGLKK